MTTLAIAMTFAANSARGGDEIALLCDPQTRSLCTEAGCKPATSAGIYWRARLDATKKSGTLERCTGSDCDPIISLKIYVDPDGGIQGWHAPTGDVFSVSPNRERYATAYAIAQDATYNAKAEFGTCRPLPTTVEEMFGN